MLAGIDLGGTQVRVALARSDGHLVASTKTKTALLATPQAMVDWSAGEIGHIIIDPNGPLDNCGQRGCLEAFVSGTALARETGHTAAELFAAAGAGDRQARSVVERAARYMGIALISLTNALDPEIFVMGGGVSRSWALVYPTMIETLRSSPFIKPARRPRLRRARLGDRAGQVGAVEWARINQ